MGKHVPPPAGVRSPMLWGDRGSPPHASSATASPDLATTRRTFAFRQRSPRDWIDYFRTYYGPTLKAFDALDDAGQDRLIADLEALIAQHNVATDGTMVVHAEYLEVVATRR